MRLRILLMIALLPLLVIMGPPDVSAQVPPPPPSQACPSGTLRTGVNPDGTPVCTRVTSLLVSPQTQFILFPLSGSLPLPFESKLALDIPYVNRNTEKEIQLPGQGIEEHGGGLGDIALRHRFKYGDEKQFAQGVTTLGVKLPTGDESQFQGGVEQVPTGMGSTDFINFSLGFHAGVLIPALTSFDRDVQSPIGRGMVFDAGFGGVFLIRRGAVVVPW